MIWLMISILCFLWILIWLIVHIRLFKESIRYKVNIRGLPLWTLLLPMIVCSITLVLFIKSVIL